VRPPGLSVGCDLRQVTGGGDVELARALFVEYAHWLEVDLCFQGFERELKDLPGAYSPPLGCLLIAGPPGEAIGCVGLRPLYYPARGEIKRLYVQPLHRGTGCARTMVAAIVARARSIGYRELVLDTLDWMSAARALYASFGFRECDAYYPNPLPGVVYMVLEV
jgi:putative acetyltransferase